MSRILLVIALMFVAFAAHTQERYLGYGEMVVERSGFDDLDFQFSFGRALAKSGDHYFVGLAGGDLASTGSVFVYEAGADGWTQVQVLDVPGRADQPDRFGLAIVAADDHIVVGAPTVDSDETADVGAVDIFALDPDTDEWVHHQTLLEPDTTANARFGSALAFADGRLYVGAPSSWQDDESAPVPGQVFVYEFDAGAEEWVQVAVEDGGGTDGDGFGAALAVSGDSLIVGAPGGAGAIHLFDVSGPAPVGVDAYEDPDADRWLGRSVSIAGSRVLAGAVPGAFREFSGGLPVGDAVLFDTAGGAFAVEETFAEVDANGFGLSVLLLDTETALISAPVDNELFLYREDAGGQWSRVQRIAEPRQSQFTARGFGEILVPLDGDVYVGEPAAVHDWGSLPSWVRGGNLYRLPIEDPPLVDLGLSVSGPAAAALGDDIAVEYTITNDSATDAGAVFLVIHRDRFDHGYIDPVDITFPNGCFELRHSTVRCELGAVDAGDSMTFTLEYNVARESLEQHLRSYSFVGSEYPDPDSTDNGGLQQATLDYPDEEPPPSGGGGGGGGHIGGALLAAMLGLLALRRRLLA